MSPKFTQTKLYLNFSEFSRNMMIRDGSRPARNGEWDLNTLMNTVVKEALGIPEHVVWGSMSNPVFDVLRGDFMKPVTDGSELSF